MRLAYGHVVRVLHRKRYISIPVQRMSSARATVVVDLHSFWHPHAPQLYARKCAVRYCKSTKGVHYTHQPLYHGAISGCSTCTLHGSSASRCHFTPAVGELGGQASRSRGQAAELPAWRRGQPSLCAAAGRLCPSLRVPRVHRRSGYVRRAVPSQTAHQRQGECTSCVLHHTSRHSV
jgi:hypothetical protein